MFLFEIAREHKVFLASIRQWSNVKIAFTDTAIWLKDFTTDQIKSASLLQIPYLIKYKVHENLLFLSHSLLPSKKMPSALMWLPIQKGLPLELPGFNHNFFGIHEKINIQIVAYESENEAKAMLTSVENLQQYIEQAPEARLRPLQWILLEDKAFIIGSPLLPIKGIVFWQMGNAFLPVGFNFEFPILNTIIDKKVNPNSDCWILWQSNNTYLALPKDSIQPLSISSFRLTVS